MSNHTTLVLGATGKTGRRVAARLRLRDTPVRTASRSSSTPFEWAEPDGWDPVLRDVATVYVVPPPVPGPEDVADAAVAVLTEPGRHAGRTCELTGPRALTFAEATELISRASGLPIAYRQVSPAEYGAALVAEGWGEDDARNVADMFVLMERGLISETSDGISAVLGREPRPFEDYVVRAAAAGAWRA